MRRLRPTSGADEFKGSLQSRDAVDYSAVRRGPGDTSTQGIIVALDNNYGDGLHYGRGLAHGDKFWSIEQIAGTIYNDDIRGSAGNEWLQGGGGDDLIQGNGGRDYLNGGDGRDTLYGGAGTDTIYGGGQNDVIHAGNDNDYIAGGEGEDVLVGGQGADTFVYNFLQLSRVQDCGHDTIRDFSAGDRIQLANLKAADIDRLVVKEQTFHEPGKGIQVKTVLQVWDGPNNLAEIDLYGVDSKLPSGGQTQINLIGRDSYVLSLADLQNL